MSNDIYVNDDKIVSNLTILHCIYEMSLKATVFFIVLILVVCFADINHEGMNTIRDYIMKELYFSNIETAEYEEELDNMILPSSVFMQVQWDTMIGEYPLLKEEAWETLKEFDTVQEMHEFVCERIGTPKIIVLSNPYDQWCYTRGMLILKNKLEHTDYEALAEVFYKVMLRAPYANETLWWPVVIQKLLWYLRLFTASSILMAVCAIIATKLLEREYSKALGGS